jgi:protein-S-isoprenylcysteine O-methyltransferase Ste14
VSVSAAAQVVWWASAVVGLLAFRDTLPLTAGRRTRWVERRGGARLGLAAVEVGAVALYLLVARGRWPLARADVAVAALALAGALLTAAGALLAIRAKRALGRDFSATFGVKEGHTLVTTGPYALVRHPIYTGLLTVAVGSALVWNDAALLAVAAVVAASFVAHVRVEEELFVRHFGDAYRDYQRTTPALVPGAVVRRRQGRSW